MVVLVSACGGFKLWVEVDDRPLEIYRRTAVVGQGEEDNVQGYFVAEPGAYYRVCFLAKTHCNSPKRHPAGYPHVTVQLKIDGQEIVRYGDKGQTISYTWGVSGETNYQKLMFAKPVLTEESADSSEQSTGSMSSIEVRVRRVKVERKKAFKRPAKPIAAKPPANCSSVPGTTLGLPSRSTETPVPEAAVSTLLRSTVPETMCKVVSAVTQLSDPIPFQKRVSLPPVSASSDDSSEEDALGSLGRTKPKRKRAKKQPAEPVKYTWPVSYYHADSDKRPFARMILRYGTRELLIANGIVPKPAELCNSGEVKPFDVDSVPYIPPDMIPEALGTHDVSEQDENDGGNPAAIDGGELACINTTTRIVPLESGLQTQSELTSLHAAPPPATFGTGAATSRPPESVTGTMQPLDANAVLNVLASPVLDLPCLNDVPQISSSTSFVTLAMPSGGDVRPRVSPETNQGVAHSDSATVSSTISIIDDIKPQTLDVDDMVIATTDPISDRKPAVAVSEVKPRLTSGAISNNVLDIDTASSADSTDDTKPFGLQTNELETARQAMLAAQAAYDAAMARANVKQEISNAPKRSRDGEDNGIASDRNEKRVKQEAPMISAGDVIDLTLD